VSVSLPILEPKAFALPTSHRIDNAVSPRQHELYNLRYIETHHVTLRLSSACCDVKSLRSSWLTTTDVRKRLSHI